MLLLRVGESVSLPACNRFPIVDAKLMVDLLFTVEYMWEPGRIQALSS